MGMKEVGKYNMDFFQDSGLFFNEIDINHEIDFKDKNHIIDKIISVKANILLGNCDVIRKSFRIMDNLGSEIEVCKVSIELFLEEIIRYSYVEEEIGLDILKNREMKNIFITIPIEMYKSNAIDLMRKQKIKIKPFIEDIYYRLIKDKRIQINVAVFTKLDVIGD